MLLTNNYIKIKEALHVESNNINLVVVNLWYRIILFASNRMQFDINDPDAYITPAYFSLATIFCSTLAYLGR